jgi:hypothetical protein
MGFLGGIKTIAKLEGTHNLRANASRNTAAFSLLNYE